MLVSKNKATNSLLKSEKKSLYRFLTLYISMVVFMIGIISIFYYEGQQKLMLYDQRAMLTKYAYIQTKRLKVLHHFFDERVTYPLDPRFQSAIYDLEYNKIFSTLEDNIVRFDKEIYLKDNYIHLVKSLDNFYLGTRYLIIEIKDNKEWRGEVLKDIFGYSLSFFILFLIFGLFLAKLFLKPMRDSMMLLDRFIKDTTHELNTPLSSILANIEMMDTSIMTDKNNIRLTRINIAAKTVSMLYKDLTYLTLEQERENENDIINIKKLIENRTEYFSILTQSKHLSCQLDLKDVSITMDRRKLTRVIDNLISNAIKYNKRNGIIGIKLRESELSIWDTGIGIEAKQIPMIFDRYRRFNDAEGGFGVGLSIVKNILDEYNISIKVEAEKNIGTKMILKWS
ncbi:MAG: HAMP domain-containing sensor histidine kinase [Sulfurovum sp.]